MLTFTSNRVLAVGEAMIEMAVIGEDTYRRSFAGDTFNTAWHMAQIPQTSLDVGYVTRVGTDTISDRFVDMLNGDGLDAANVGRDPDRTMGLYMIELAGAERSFSYWRDASAARYLAHDSDWMDRAFAGAGLIHLSGITLGILDNEGRERLANSLEKIRKTGTRISFDPNVRPRLWASLDSARASMAQFFSITDIALPSFDDEAALWGDLSPDQTIKRIAAFGVSEVVVKNGAAPVSIHAVDRQDIPTRQVAEIHDTSGAGDAFNAGYLAARLSGSFPASAVVNAQAMAAEVIRHFGARIPSELVPQLHTRALSH
jgi:2-dehydro-3-deoxygluconokinase